jgi:hypothetical protein
MPLSWNEIRHRAIACSKEWKGAKGDQAEKQTLEDEFLNRFRFAASTVGARDVSPTRKRWVRGR